MSGRYHVTGIDDSAPGMERLRNQSEFILLAYPAKESTPADLVAQWLADVDSCDRPDGFDYESAESAIRQFAADCDHYLKLRLAAAARQRETEAGEADSLGCDFDYEPAPFRLYVRDNAPDAD